MKLKHYITGLIIILVDQLTKYLIINKEITIIPNIIDFNYTQNISGAFGFGNQAIITIFSIIIIISIIIFLFKECKNTTNYIPYILILSGSISNLIDRLLRGYVIDFIDFNIFNFPNFNIADICIVFGIGLIFIYLIKYCHKGEKI